MKILKKMSRLGIALLILNEVRGILVVIALLSGGAQALAHQGQGPGGSPTAVTSGF